MPDRYLLRVTAGSEYALSNHTVVPVNAVGPSASDGVVHISTDLVDAQVAVRVRDYRGLPRGSPAHSPYFETTPHDVNGDRYGIAIRFRLKRPPGDDVPDVTVEEERDSDDDLAYGDSSSSEDGEQQQGHQQSQRRHGVSAHDLQFGNDLDHPIRDRLPPGFNTALGILRWWIDPGLDGDAYADRPYLYGPALSSWNVVHVGAKHPDSDVNGHKHHIDEEKGGLYFEEGGHADGIRLREETSAPAAAKDRMKWALRKENKDRWIWEYDRWYGAEFFNPYVDFSEFALRLPGFTLPVLKYWDGKSGLRWVSFLRRIMSLSACRVLALARPWAAN